FLILDEPTHHLDIQSKDVLKEALKNYDGTFLIVSHDRDFLTGLTNRLLELDDLRIRDQHMDILELIAKRKALQSADIGKSSTARLVERKTPANSDQHEKRERGKDRRRMQMQLERIEKKLADLEQEEKVLQEQVMRTGSPTETVQKGYERLGVLAKTIAAAMEEWEGISVQLEELEEQ
nr:hypothetical protein [Flavobacteriales bacterium]